MGKNGFGMANFRRKRNTHKFELRMKYRWKGIAKTNYRKLPKKVDPYARCD